VSLLDSTNSKLIETSILKIAENDEAAFEHLYLETKDAVFAYCLSLLKNYHDAEDIMHDTYLKIHLSASSYLPMGKPMAWIFKIVKNLCLDKQRKDAAHPTEAIEDWKDYLVENKQLSIEDKLVVQTCLEKLKPQEAEILILHVVVGLKHIEIARICKLPLATVLSKYTRTIKKMRVLLEMEGNQ